MSITTHKKYTTEDGVEFDDIELAKQHEQLLFVMGSIKNDPHLSAITTAEVMRIMSHLKSVFNITPRF